MAINGRALTAVSVGILFVWSGIRGWSVLGTIGDVISGRKPNQAIAYPLELPANEMVGVAPPISGGGNAIAAIGLEYIGHEYRFGGAPGVRGDKPWDCSSFVNYVVGVRARMAIPGNAPGRYSGNTHGPPTGSWAVWTGMTTIKRSEVQAGDIILWLGHMGIAINNSQVVNALNPTKDTIVTDIDRGVGRGPLVRCGRL
jgi:cell wall-associated NlpC family hydrolase